MNFFPGWQGLRSLLTGRQPASCVVLNTPAPPRRVDRPPSSRQCSRRAAACLRSPLSSLWRPVVLPSTRSPGWGRPQHSAAPPPLPTGMLPPHLPNSTVPLPSPYGPMLFRVTDHAREQDYLHEIAGGAPFPLNFPSQGPLPTSFYNLGLPTMGPSLPFFFPPPPEAFIRLQIAQHVGIIGPNPKQLTAEYFQSLEVGQQMAMLVYILSPPPPAPSSQQGAETTPRRRRLQPDRGGWGRDAPRVRRRGAGQRGAGR